MSLLVLISGHGFGHWTRCEALLEPLAAELPIHLRTCGRALGVARRRATWAASVEAFDTGPGVIQEGPLSVDVPATRQALEAHLGAWEELVAAGAAEARALGARGILGVAPPIAFPIARAAGLPSLGLANFAWSWAYGHYAAQDPFFAEAERFLAAAEGQAGGLIALPGGGGLERLGAPEPSFAIRRQPTRERAAARALLPVPLEDPRPRVLLSFGGFGASLDLSGVVGRLPEWAFVIFAPPQGEVPENLWVLPHDHGLPHQDLVLGSDLVLAKPGYGTISECFNRPTPMVWVVPRSDPGFREHQHLPRWLQATLPNAPLSVEDLLAGRWEQALGAAAAAPAPPPPPNPLAEVQETIRAHLLGSG